MPDDISLPARASNRDLQTMRFEEALEVYTPSLADALPDHIQLRRFKRVLLTAVNLNPKLAKADRRSLFNACVKCAHDGLYPDGREAVLLDFDTNVKTVNDRGMDVWVKVPMVSYLPMVAGIRKRMRNSGEVVAAISEVVYRNDKFRVIKGIEGRIEHEPPALDEDRGDAVGAYAQIKLRTGEILQEVMTKREIEHIRDTFSRGAEGAKSPWKTSESEMWRKTVLRRCAKSAPSDSDLDRLLNRDDEPLDEPHPAALPPPRPTRERMTGPEWSKDFADERQERIEALADPDPAETGTPPDRKEERLHHPHMQSEAGSPQEPKRPRRHRRTKAQMEADRATESSTRAAVQIVNDAAARDTQEFDDSSKPYAVVDPYGELHEFDAPTKAADFLASLFETAKSLAVLDALRDDNSATINQIKVTDPEACDALRQTYSMARLNTSEFAIMTPATTESPHGTDDAPEPDRQAPAAQATPIAAAGVPLPAGGPRDRPQPVSSPKLPAGDVADSYKIEPVYTKTGQVDRAWWVALLLPKLRQSKNLEEFALRRAANALTIEAYKKTLAPAGIIAAMKDIDDIEREIPA